jgi:ABC-2 type transport system ATP-binding protein
MQESVVVDRVSKRFGSLTAVDDVSLQIRPGEIFGMLGPNGAGKTTTIRMILDILRPDSGRIEVFGGPMTEAKKNRIGYLPEERGLYADIKLLDVIRYLASLKGMKRAAITAAAENYLKQLDLWQHRDKKMSALSRGMHQKAQFIVTVLHDPHLIIVDEPFSGLDPVNTELIRQMLLEMRRQGKAIVMSSHQMHQIETMCDRMALIHRGQVVLDGPVLEVRRRFSGNTVEVSGQGAFDQLPNLSQAEQINGAWRLTLADGADPKLLLREIAQRDDLLVEHFSVALPGLHEIFIRVVGEDGEADNEQLTVNSQQSTVNSQRPTL